MNDTPNEFDDTPDEEAQLTAFVLGELSEMDTAAVARRVERDPALGREVEAIRATADDVAKALAGEIAPALTPAQRAAITGGPSAADGGRNGVLFSFLSLRTVWAGAGLAAAACLAIAFLWPAIAGSGRSQGPVAYKDKEAAPEGPRARALEKNEVDRNSIAASTARPSEIKPSSEPVPDRSVDFRIAGSRSNGPAALGDAARAQGTAGLDALEGSSLGSGAPLEPKTAGDDGAAPGGGAAAPERRPVALKRAAPGTSIGAIGGAGGGAAPGGDSTARQLDGEGIATAAPSSESRWDDARLGDLPLIGGSLKDGPALAFRDDETPATVRNDIADRIRASGEAPGDFNREAYGHLVDNEFKRPTEAPQSTFSLDVDTASYSNVRRFIEGGQLPPKDAVRIEELINYFDYAYEPATGEHPFSVTTDMRPCPWNTDDRLVRIGLRARDVERDMRPATSLVFLIDVSGSMDDANKLPLVKESLRLLVRHLTADDRVGIVVYAGAAGLVLPSTFCDDRETIVAALDRLHAGGSTAGGAGIDLAYRVAQDSFIEGGVNRVILCTDGDFNVGVSSEGDLVHLIEEKRRSGVFLSVLGFGTGDFQDERMEKLSNAGNGNFAYIDRLEEARKVLVEEMAGTLVTIAKDVKIQVEFNPARVGAYRLIGYANRIMATQDFRNDRKDAGEIGAGHTMTALYEITEPTADLAVPENKELRFQEPPALAEAAQTDELLQVSLRYKQPDGDTSTEMSRILRDDASAAPAMPEDFDFAAAVAGFGMLLRDSADKGSVDYDMVLRLAGGETRPDANERQVAVDLADRFAEQVKRERIDLAAVFAQSLTSVELTDTDLAATIDADPERRRRFDTALAACPRGEDADARIDRLRVRLAKGRMTLGTGKTPASRRHRAEFIDLVRRAREIAGQ